MTLCIDGSLGEGGGQILRSSLALSLVTGLPIRIDRIRAGRKKPGLMRQHLTAVRAAVEVCGGSAKGAAIGSRELVFEPRPPRGGEYQFRVGTAGSTTLVLQTVLPALLLADAPSALVLEGGTHNPWAPPVDFLQRVYLPQLNRMGPRVTITLDRHGFHPAGGGKLRARIEPTERLRGFDLIERGELLSRSVHALVANLPLHVAEREAARATRKLGWDPRCSRITNVPSSGPGNVLMAEVQFQHVTELCAAFGRRGVPAETVADEAIDEMCSYLDGDAPVGSYLTDQLLLPLAISVWQAKLTGDGSRECRFRALPLSLHATTQIDILRQFLGIHIDVEDAASGSRTIRLHA